MCTLYQSLAMMILYDGRMTDVFTQEFFISRIVVSVANSVSIYWFFVSSALIQCFRTNDQDTILPNDKDGNNCFNTLYGMHCFLRHHGFASWQATASGSMITEIMEDTSSWSIAIAFLQVQR